MCLDISRGAVFERRLALPRLIAEKEVPMRLSVPLENGLLPDLYGKYAPEEALVDGHPCVSFPIEVTDVPPEARTLALAFVDWDAIPVGGFCWIHWLACNIPVEAVATPNGGALIPENASASGAVPCVQGTNSDFSPLAGGHSNPAVIRRYAGPFPPDKTHEYTLTVYALDSELPLTEGYYMNEFRRAIRGHVLAEAELDFPSRS